MSSVNKSFHTTIDRYARAFQVFTPVGSWKPSGTIVRLRQRKVSYRFFPHFHPYVGASRAFVPGLQLSLIERLNDGGIPELQDSDTLYLPQPNPPSGR